MDPNKRTLFTASLVLILSAGNLSRLSGLECIRTIHVVTLLTMGGALGILIQSAWKQFRKKQ